MHAGSEPWCCSLPVYQGDGHHTDGCKPKNFLALVGVSEARKRPLGLRFHSMLRAQTHTLQGPGPAAALQALGGAKLAAVLGRSQAPALEHRK